MPPANEVFQGGQSEVRAEAGAGAWRSLKEGGPFHGGEVDSYRRWRRGTVRFAAAGCGLRAAAGLWYSASWPSISILRRVLAVSVRLRLG